MTGEKDAPAEMPGVEEIGKLLYERVCGHYGAKPYWENEPAEIHKLHGSMAIAILALFAPILAENASLRETLRSNSVWDFPRDIQNLTVKLDAAEARALAAEAALAAERERCIAIVDAQVPDWVKERSGPYWDGYREAMEDAAEDMRKGVPARAAAIRAQGE